MLLLRPETQVLYCTGTFIWQCKICQRKKLHSLNNPLKFQTYKQRSFTQSHPRTFSYLIGELQIFQSSVPLSNPQSKLIFYMVSSGLHSFTYICSALIAWFLNEKGNVTCFHDSPEREKFRTIEIPTKFFQETIDVDPHKTLILADIISIEGFSKLKIQTCQVYLMGT